jgi:hypothetical protein
MVALHIVRVGRLGNNILQIYQALLFARQIGAQIVDVSGLNLFMFNPEFKSHLCSDGLLITRSGIPSDAKVIKDQFFGEKSFGGITFTPDVNLIPKVFEEIRNVMGIDAEICGTSNDIYCHVRSGDIFLRPRPKANYVQPPLSFYMTAAKDMLMSGNYERIRVVYETKDNPVIDGLLAKENWFGVPVVPQSGTLSEDITEILKARGIVMGAGTFIPMMCAISGKIQEASMFRESYSAKAFWPGSGKTHLLGFLGTQVNHYTDDGSYIPVNGWEICHPDTEKSLEQKRMILDFPIEKIKKVK